MGIVEQLPTNQVLKERTGGQLPAQPGQVIVEQQRRDGIVIVQPGSELSHQQQQGVRILVAHHLAMGKFQLVNRRLDLL